MTSLYRVLKSSAADELNNLMQQAVFQEFVGYDRKAKETPRKDQEGDTPEIYVKPQRDEILEEAMEKAEQILQEARDEAERMKQEGYDAGYAEGLTAGREAGSEEARKECEAVIAGLQDQVQQYAEDVSREKDRILESYVDDLKNISLAIGEKIVKTSLKSSSDVVKRMIIAATEKLKKTTWAKIYISSDFSKGEKDIQGDAELLSSLSHLSDHVKIIVMEDADPGTCIVELPGEVMDISVGTQMENIKEILSNARA